MAHVSIFVHHEGPSEHTHHISSEDADLKSCAGYLIMKWTWRPKHSINPQTEYSPDIQPLRGLTFGHTVWRSYVQPNMSKQVQSSHGNKKLNNTLYIKDGHNHYDITTFLLWMFDLLPFWRFEMVLVYEGRIWLWNKGHCRLISYRLVIDKSFSKEHILNNFYFYYHVQN